MRLVKPSPGWPESWVMSYEYDLLEVYGGHDNPAYSRSYEERRRRAVGAVVKAAEPPARVLDVAGAQGNFSIALAELGYQVTWNDIRADLQDYVELKRTTGLINYVPGNIFELDLGQFDVVLMTEVIEHVAHPDQFLQRVATLVSPHGRIVMTTPNGQYIRNTLPRFSDCPDPSIFESEQFQPNADGHIFLLHIDEVRSLASQAGLVVEREEFFTNSFTAGHMKTASIANLMPKGWLSALESTTSNWSGRVGRACNTQMLTTLRRIPS